MSIMLVVQHDAALPNLVPGFLPSGNIVEVCECTDGRL
jgi:hypothetical protein